MEQSGRVAGCHCGASTARRHRGVYLGSLLGRAQPKYAMLVAAHFSGWHNTPPGDLTASGSPSFNTFVTAFVTHCSPNNNCVKDYIKYYEMWNEWDIQYHWTGTMAQVYQMVAPAAPIIKSNVPGAVILTPSTTPDSDSGIGYQADLQNWLNYETQNGRISDWIAWHVYLTAQQNNQTQIVTPETQWGNFNVNFLSVQASTPGWTTTPWADTETNYNGAPPPGL